MTITEHSQREQQQRPQPDGRAAAANRQHAAEQRDVAAAVNTAVTAAHAERTRAKHLGADKRRLAEAFEVLSGQINGREDMTVLEPGNVLRHSPGGPEQGTANLAAVCEFVARIMRGELPDDALEEMHEQRLERHLAPAVRHAESTYQRAHRLENAATVPAALPPSGAAPVSNGHVQLPQRQVPSAPLEKPAEQTGKIALAAIEAMLAEGHDMSASSAKLAEHGYAGPDYGPAADPKFTVTALPQARLADTQRMAPIQGDEFELTADGPVEASGDAPAPRPLADAASTAASSRQSHDAGSRADAGSGSGDGDE